MKKVSAGAVIICAVIYLLLYPVGSACGLIHPMCYAFVGTILPLLFAFVYLYTAAHMRCFGAALCLNGFVLIAGLITGEADVSFIIITAVITLAAELIRMACGYDTLKGVRYSFVPFAYSFYAYTAHWWTDTENALAAAVEEMPEGYAAKMQTVIDNVPLLCIALILVIPVAILAMRLAEKVMKKTAASLN